MALTSGTKLGPYEIQSPLGSGGMGEVYRARDTKLGGDVALKFLPEAFASDIDRMARFKREAQMLASLNHPNIAAIYGFEDGGERPALVMELVDGPTLADRIARGSIPPDEALMRVLVSGGAGEPIPIQGSLPVAPSRISPNAVGKDGRIVLSIAPPDSWFLDVGILDPRSGKLERVPINLTGGGYAIYRRAADGSGADEKVPETPGSEIEPYSVSPDGR